MKKVFEVRWKRAAAVALSLTMAIGFAGCDAFGSRKKSKDAINDRLVSFNKALQKLDYEAARRLTDWTKEDNDYTAIESLFDASDYGDAEGEGFVICTEYIASTISIKYDISTVQIKNDQATLNVKYEMVDWPSVYQKSHDSYDQVLEDLTNCQDKSTTDAVIIFENVDGRNDWRLCRISDLGKVMSFVHTLPVRA